jgi:hypothetical protein
MYGQLLQLPHQDLLRAIATTTSRPPSNPGRKCRRRRGLGRSSKDPARTSTKGAAPATPSGGVIEQHATMEHSRISRAALLAGAATVARMCGPAGPSRGLGLTFRRTNQMCSTNSLRLRRRYDRLPRLIAAVTRTTGPRSFGGAGLYVDQWLGGCDSMLTCVCSWTGVSNGPGYSYPAAESRANVLCYADL